MSLTITIPEALRRPLETLAAGLGRSVDEVACDLLSTLVTGARTDAQGRDAEAGQDAHELVAWTVLRDEVLAGVPADERAPLRLTIEKNAFLYPSPTARLSFRDPYLSLRLDYQGQCVHCASRGTRLRLEPLWIETVDTAGAIIVTFSAICQGCGRERDVVLLMGSSDQPLVTASGYQQAV